jgi:tetratricopeptide (TPR) repeat protein
LLAGDKATTIAKWCSALASGSGTAVDRVRLGILYKDRAEWRKAAAQFERAVQEIPDYAEAHRELGIARNNLAQETMGPISINAAETGELPGEEQLKRAIKLNEEDFDATASCGGLYKRAGRLQDSMHMYKQSTKISKGHPYPLLNLLKLEAEHCGALNIQPETRRMLEDAERFRAPQANMLPAYDAPWSQFDLAEIKFLLGAPEGEEVTALVDAGIRASTAPWQISSFHDSLNRLGQAGIECSGSRIYFGPDSSMQSACRVRTESVRKNQTCRRRRSLLATTIAKMQLISICYKPGMQTRSLSSSSTAGVRTWRSIAQTPPPLNSR